jgi:phage terminase small subunit
MLGMNKFNAAMAAGYSKNTAENHTAELDERIKITDMLDRQGLTDKVLVAKHLELLNAYRLMTFEGKVIAVESGGIKIPELPTQIKALEIAYKLKDLLKEKLEHSGAVTTGETRIIIVQNAPQKEDARSLSEAQTIPRALSPIS